jgi:hypothetical protein
MPEHKRRETQSTEELESVRKKKSLVTLDRVKARPAPEVGSSPAEHAAALAAARSDEQRASIVAGLQQTHGNRYVEKLLDRAPARRDTATKTREAPRQITVEPVEVVQMRDGANLIVNFQATLDGEQITLAQGTQTARQSQGTETASQGEGTETAIERELEIIEESLGGAGAVEDAIQAQLGVFYTINQGQISVGTAFGMASYAISPSIWVTPRRSPSGNRYDVRIRAACRYKWDVKPQGRKNVSAPRDPDVNADSWSQIAYDLTPAGSPARSPRVEHWCQDLTAKHERFHIQDWIGAFRTHRPTTETWLRGQAASSSQDAVNLARDAVSLLATNVNTYMGSGDSSPAEVRAYNDGAPSYRERANAVRARGTAEKWDEGIVIL